MGVGSDVSLGGLLVHSGHHCRYLSYAAARMSQLMAMLLQAGVLSPDRAREARGHQVIFGDRIGTNLLALDFLNESTLAQALGALHGVAWAAGSAAETKPALVRGLPRQLAARYSAVPALVDDQQASIFMMDPRDPEALAALSAHYRRGIVPVVVCEGRMWALLHKFYLVRRGMRALKLDVASASKRTTLVPRRVERQASSVGTAIEIRPDGAVTQVPTPSSVIDGPMPPPPSPPAPLQSRPSLIPQGDHPALQLGAVTPIRPMMAIPAVSSSSPSPVGASSAPRAVDASWLGTPSSVPVAGSSSPGPALTSPTSSPLVRSGALTDILPPLRAETSSVPAAGGWLVAEAVDDDDDDVDDELEVIEAVDLAERPKPVARRPLGFAEAEVSLDEFDGAGEVAAEVAVENDVEVAVEDDLEHDVEHDVVEDAVLLGALVDEDPGERTPLSFDEAKAALARISDRNAIARIVLRYAMSRVRRAVLLTVQGAAGAEEALGWDALGEKLRPGLVHDIRLPLSTSSSLKLAWETRGHVLGPLAASAVNDELVSVLGGGGPPKTAFVMPILARGRVVNLLYLDDGPGRFMVPDIGELLILCQAINKSYDTLLSRA